MLFHNSWLMMHNSWALNLLNAQITNRKNEIYCLESNKPQTQMHHCSVGTIHKVLQKRIALCPKKITTEKYTQQRKLKLRKEREGKNGEIFKEYKYVTDLEG